MWTCSWIQCKQMFSLHACLIYKQMAQRQRDEPQSKSDHIHESTWLPHSDCKARQEGHAQARWWVEHAPLWQASAHSVCCRCLQALSMHVYCKCLRCGSQVMGWGCIFFCFQQHFNAADWLTQSRLTDRPLHNWYVTLWHPVGAERVFMWWSFILGYKRRTSHGRLTALRALASRATSSLYRDTV